ncbi:beta-ketoacyl-[acyl-carrier-protein] synthase family protein [Cytobacillus purgationiresistens]|uniref:3-oxoacyl-[acyl-carrier-protein] synthase II n=1 Tax=Cytobacillus purgationiresistens TaxID=863449 RepID=A0ABU0ANX7_9BACI|nr:beta-ketoacyl-[acyl-carrier-protein] synthase family protein [Cytobacillus purgationiresistens]MDQ0272998.1 3-oxoacyl-[acyl-carrier-protein] synthase II [Cytobacillus purgationiresistens]
MSKRVVITGIGVISPIGITKELFWDNLCTGTIGTKEDIKAFNTDKFDTHIGGEVKDFDPSPYFEYLNPNDYGRTTQLAVAATKMAIKDAQIDTTVLSEETSVCIGTTMGNNSVIENYHDLNNANQMVKPEFISHYPANHIAAAISEELGSMGTTMVIPTACAAGNYAIGFASDLIKDGKATIAIAGGADAMSRVIYTTFHRLGALSDDASKPFDKNRNGINVSEGAGILILEDYEYAINRGARIYAELKGYGLACDAHHPTAPHPEGEGAIQAALEALKESGLSKEDISYINAHGTGTRANDHTESIAIKYLFGERADTIPVSSIKSMLGHTMGAASAIEAACCSLAIYHSVIPPTMNHEVEDPECVKNVVPNKSLATKVNYALSNSFAFGGNVASIILGRYTHA